MNIKMKAIAILLSLVVFSGISMASACDTRTPGYWKNHYPEAWPASASITYSDPEVPPYTTYNWILPGGSLQGALDILNTPVRGDASINLQQKVIAAIISIAADKITGWSYPPNFAGGPMGGATLPELIDQSFTWLDAHPTCLPGSEGRAQGLELASAIDYWLNLNDVG